MAKRIAVLWNPDTPSHAPALKALDEAGRMLRVQLQPVGARTAAEFVANEVLPRLEKLRLRMPVKAG